MATADQGGLDVVEASAAGPEIAVPGIHVKHWSCNCCNVVYALCDISCCSGIKASSCGGSGESSCERPSMKAAVSTITEAAVAAVAAVRGLVTDKVVLATAATAG